MKFMEIFGNVYHKIRHRKNKQTTIHVPCLLKMKHFRLFEKVFKSFLERSSFCAKIYCILKIYLL